MKRAAKKSKQRRDPEAQARRFVAQSLRLIEGPCDREALRLLSGAGFLAVENPSELDDAYERLADKGADREYDDWTKKYYSGPDDAPLTGDPENAISALMDAELARSMARSEAAYLLGIAVGRRLGAQPLTVKGGGK